MRTNRKRAKAERLDYRQGGRVQYAEGDTVEKTEQQKKQEKNLKEFENSQIYKNWKEQGGIGTADMGFGKDGTPFSTGTEAKLYDKFLESGGQNKVPNFLTGEGEGKKDRDESKPKTSTPTEGDTTTPPSPYVPDVNLSTISGGPYGGGNINVPGIGQQVPQKDLAYYIAEGTVGAQTDDSQVDAGKNYYWDPLSNAWHPTSTLIASEQSKGSVWDAESKTWVSAGLLAGKNITSNAASQDLKDQFEKERAARILEEGKRTEKIAKGDTEGLVPTAEVSKVPMDTDTISSAVKMGEIPKLEGTSVAPITPEQVSVVDSLSKAVTPQQLQAAKYDAAQILQSPNIQGAQGTLNDAALANAVGVSSVPTIATSDVVVQEGAVAERIIGTLTEGAKVTAAATAGTTLGRLTRAKKQLRKAGLSEDDITAIGDDPSLLEDRLTDFTETERGVLEGLPTEALVSTQLNTLLEGVESGTIPTWAQPAVSAVDQMLAARGLEASTIGREQLLNVIIQSAVPIAQANATAIQQSIGQQKGIDAQVALKEAEFRQQAALQNAQNEFGLNISQFNTDQQTTLANSKFFQTTSLANASMEQQGVIQDAVLLSQRNLAEADITTKLNIQNAQAFLNMDMANLTNEQQAVLLKGQQDQQRLLSNQASANASRQFNAASENQTNQFMTSIAAQVSQFNAQQENVTAQFNAQQQNAAEARRAGIEADVNKANAAIVNQTKQFNAQLDYNRTQWNAQNEQVVQQSNVQWRRNANLADTAAQNAVNQQNVQNSFALSSAAQSQLWQELRDQADYDFRWAEGSANRRTQAMISAASAEGDAAKNWAANFNNISNSVNKIFGD